jgi:putative membrane protein
MTTVFAFLHHLCAFTMVGAIAVEFVLLGQATSSAPGSAGLTLPVARRLIATDAVLGIAAGLLLAIGLLRVFYFEKGSAYYFASPAFSAKLAIFIAIGLISIVPTREFLSWRKAVASGQVPSVSADKLQSMKRILHGEIFSIAGILFCAAVMARGGLI